MYGAEAKELLVWGKEGTTYKIVNGEREYITDANASQKEKLFGLQTFGIAQQSDVKSVAISYKGQCLDALVNKTEKDSEQFFNPKWWMDYTKDEKDVKLSIEETIKSRMQQNISKFVIGELNMDQWDNYVSGIKQLGLDKYMAIFKSAYDRVK